jgi:hypothetical protein
MPIVPNAAQIKEAKELVVHQQALTASVKHELEHLNDGRMFKVDDILKSGLNAAQIESVLAAHKSGVELQNKLTALESSFKLHNQFDFSAQQHTLQRLLEELKSELAKANAAFPKGAPSVLSEASRTALEKALVEMKKK